MAAAESLEKSRAETARRPEPALSTEQTSLQSLSPQRKSGTTVELPVRGSNGQLSAEVDGSTAVAATALVSEARRHADRSYRRNPELLPYQGSLRSRRGDQRQHPNADQPGTRLQEYALSTPESETHGRHKHRIRRDSANQTGRVNCNFLQIPAQSPFMVKLFSGMPDNSFDVASQIEMPEVINAIQQATKEITTRYDLKDSKSNIELNEKDKKLTLTSADDFKLKAVTEILQQKLVKRGVPIRNLTFGTVQSAAGSTVKQEVTLQSGISIEKARDIVKKIKDSKVKVQASIQGDVVRVSGKDRDTLQQIIALLKGADFGIELQFTNYRTN